MSATSALRVTAPLVIGRGVADWPSHFSAIGAGYDERAFAGASLAALGDRELAIVLASVGAGRGRRLLDIGAGTGRFSAALVAAGWRVTAFDGSSEMLRCLSARVPESERVQGRLGDPLPFAAGRFAAVVAMRVLKYVIDTPSALSEVARVAEPGAPVVFDAANGRSLARFGYVGSPMGFVTPTSILRLAAEQGLTVDAVHDGPRLPHAVLARASSPLASHFTDAVERGLGCVLGSGRGARSLIVEASRAD